MHWGFVLVAAVLLAAAWALMWWQVREWHVVASRAEGDAELEAASAAYRRRMQGATLIGVLAGAVFFGQWMQSADRTSAAYWLGVLAIVAWLVLLALWDAIASIRRVSALRQDYRRARRRLEEEIDEIRATHDE